jgi:low affinity Fe/Cu permease
MNDIFRRFAHAVSHVVGSAWTFSAALAIIIVWAATGPIFGFSNTWQLIINTCTTIVTVLIVFLIQNTQNRDAEAIHLKLDELIRAVQGARPQLIDLEELPDEKLKSLREEFHRIQTTHEVDLDEHLAQIDEAVRTRRGESTKPQKSDKPDDAG